MESLKLSKNDYAEVIDLAVISFFDHTELIRPFSPSNIPCEIALTVYDPTVLGEGIQTALQSGIETKNRRT